MSDRSSTETESSPTIPDDYKMSFHGIETEDEARAIGDQVHAWLTEVSRTMDLERLDGVTVTWVYARSLAGLDRGFEHARAFTAGENEVAMAVAVKRDGVLKSHLVLDAGILHHLSDTQSDAHHTVLHLLACQCGHIDGLKQKDIALPGLFAQLCTSHFDVLFNEILWSCWDDYAASRLSTRYATDEVFDERDETFIHLLRTTRSTTNAFVKDISNHRDGQKLCAQVFGQCGELMRSACSFLGDRHGADKPLEQRPQVLATLNGHWFMPFFRQLDRTLSELSSRHGKWEDSAEFDAISDIIRAVLADSGLQLTRGAPNEWRLAIFYNDESRPDA